MKNYLLLPLILLLLTTSCMKTNTITTVGCSSYLKDATGQTIGYIIGAGLYGVALSTKNDCGNDPYHSSYQFNIDTQTGEIDTFISVSFYTKTTMFDVNDTYFDMGGVVSREYFEIRPSQATIDPIQACISEKSELITMDATVYKYIWRRAEQGNYLEANDNHNTAGWFKGAKVYPCTRSEVGIPETITPPLQRVEMDSTLRS